MKKILFALCAVAALASCTNNEVVNLDKEAISFGGAFVDNATKASDTFTITTEGLKKFGKEFFVWATTQRPDSDEIVPILEEVKVFNDIDGGWKYDAGYTQYWIPGNTYQFAAVKNGTVTELENGLPKTISCNLKDAHLDLLYAKDTRVGLQSGNAAVSFTFNHLLAKAYFTVKTQNMSGKNPNYTYVIKDVEIQNAAKEATCNVAGSAPVWAAPTSTYVVKFGDVRGAALLAAKGTYTSDKARLLIPASYDDLNITFTIETLYDGSIIDSRQYDQKIAYTFLRNYEYNFLLELGDPGDEIKFTVNKVEGWKQDGATIPSI